MKAFEIIKKIGRHESPDKTIIAIQELHLSLKETLSNVFQSFVNLIATPVKMATQILASLLFLGALFVMITSKSSIIGSIQSLTVLSGSMSPQIPVGSIVMIEKDWPYKIGDIISFKNKEGLTITHRIVNKLPQGLAIFYRVKGDANNLPDSQLIAENAILGKQIFTIPYLGRLTVFLRTTPGYMGLIILPSLIFIGLELFSIKKELEKEFQKKIISVKQSDNAFQI